jgi:asparagine synthase (glutamine-hydrolysing)
MFDSQPFRHAETGCVITADARLDNRDELLCSLDLEVRDSCIGDGKLILLAYLKWGENSLDRLLGDFAFAIWDPRNLKLFCARDHFGMRPLNYHYYSGQRFVFASDPHAILWLPQVPCRINEGRIADFLVPELERIDFTSTFYEDIYRLPPGHKVVVTANGMEISEYWKPDPGSELACMSDEECAEGFLEVFTKSMAARLRAPHGTVCSMLSGGIDSGTVAAVAGRILASWGAPPIPTYSAIRRDVADCAETRAIQAAMSLPAIAPNLVDLETVLDTEWPLTTVHEEPYDAEMMMIQCIYRAAQGDGYRVVLDGMGGDVVLSEGSYIVRLLRSGQVGTALREVMAESRFWGDDARVKALFRYGRAAFAPKAVRKMLTTIRRDHRMKEAVSSSLISASFAERIDIARRLELLEQTLGREWTATYAV